MKLAVVGSRDFPYLWMVGEILARMRITVEIVSGGARGVDTVASNWARYHEMSEKIFLPDWDRFGKSAGYRRNTEIVDYCDELIAFQFNKSRGTQHSIDLARKAGKLREVIEVTRQEYEAVQ